MKVKLKICIGVGINARKIFCEVPQSIFGKNKIPQTVYYAMHTTEDTQNWF